MIQGLTPANGLAWLFINTLDAFWSMAGERGIVFAANLRPNASYAVMLFGFKGLARLL